MIGLYIAALLVCLCGIRIKYTGFYDDFLGKRQCNAVKGFFIMLVFISHVSGYISGCGYGYDGFGDLAFKHVQSLLGQFIVVMFLFYSGYGVMESIKKNGDGYINAMPRKRLLSVLLNFDVAVCVFLVVNIIVGINVSWRQVILSLWAWDSIGNSNWYIFVVLVCYALTYICFKIGTILSKKTVHAGWFVCAAVLCSIVLLSFFKQAWWYNTMLAYPAGLLVSLYNDKTKGFVIRNYNYLLLILPVAFIGLLIIGYDCCGLKHNALSLLFAVIVVMLTMKVKVENPALVWLGSLLFPLYIYQRVPMMVLHKWLGPAFVSGHIFVYVIACATLTVSIAFLYRFWKIEIR